VSAADVVKEIPQRPTKTLIRRGHFRPLPEDARPNAGTGETGSVDDILLGREDTEPRKPRSIPARPSDFRLR
jgi:hypothetical protein